MSRLTQTEPGVSPLLAELRSSFYRNGSPRVSDGNFHELVAQLEGEYSERKLLAFIHSFLSNNDRILFWILCDARLLAMLPRDVAVELAELRESVSSALLTIKESKIKNLNITFHRGIRSL